MIKGIYKLFIDCGRNGHIDSVFISYDLYVKTLINEEVEVYFGEIFGKHSEVYGSIKDENIKLITEDPKVIEIFEQYDFNSGYNPFDCTVTHKYLETVFEEEIENNDNFDYDVSVQQVVEKLIEKR